MSKMQQHCISDLIEWLKDPENMYLIEAANGLMPLDTMERLTLEEKDMVLMLLRIKHILSYPKR